jgi:uncharacterized protein with GYD domain
VIAELPSGGARVVLEAVGGHDSFARNQMEDDMPMFIISMNWTDQAIRAIKDADKRAKYGRELGKKFGVKYKELYMTSGDSDLLAIVEAENGDDVAKFVLALSSRGNVRTRTCRAWPEAEYLGVIKKAVDKKASISG